MLINFIIFSSISMMIVIIIIKGFVHNNFFKES